jgi:hypothetical protein
MADMDTRIKLLFAVPDNLNGQVKIYERNLFIGQCHVESDGYEANIDMGPSRMLFETSIVEKPYIDANVDKAGMTASSVSNNLATSSDGHNEVNINLKIINKYYEKAKISLLYRTNKQVVKYPVAPTSTRYLRNGDMLYEWMSAIDVGSNPQVIGLKLVE